MRRLLLSIMMLLALVASAATTPDFSYPAKVKATAAGDLNRGLSTGDGPLIVRSLMDCTLAQSQITTDSIDAELNLIAGTAAQSKSTDVKAMCALLRATLLTQTYLADRSNFDRRPAAASSGTINEWNGEQFRSEIVAALTSALDRRLASTGLKKWLGVTTLTADEVALYPTLYDFVAYRSIALLSSLADFMPEVSNRISAIYANLIDINRTKTPALITAEVARLKYLKPAALTDSLLALSKRHAKSPYGGEALIAASLSPSASMSAADLAQWKAFVAELRQRLARYPGYVHAGCLQNRLNALTAPSLTLTSPSVVSPAEPATVKVANLNSSKVKVEIFIVPSTVKASETRYKLTALDLTSRHFATVETTSADSLTVPFISTVDLQLPLLPLGRYVLVPVADGCDAQIFDKNYRIVNSTGLMTVTTAYADSRWTSVLDIVDGSPIKGATVEARNNQSSLLWSATTDRRGEAAHPAGSTSGLLYAVKGDDHYAWPVSQAWSTSNPGPKSAMSVTAYTSLPLYHPGDSVAFAAILQSVYGSASRPLAGVKLQAVVRNPNYRAVDTLTAATDDFGRISGGFRLPVEGLTGDWTIIFSQQDKKATLGSRRFTVSDYRLPDYLVAIDEVRRGDTLTVAGTASTYSGFPVADARVALCLTAVKRGGWRWMGNETAVVKRDTVTTDSRGRFLFAVDSTTLASSPWPDAVMEAEVTFTSTTNEIATDKRRFTLGRQYSLNVVMGESLDASRPVAFRSALTNLEGGVLEAPLCVTVIDSAGRQVAESVVDNNTLDLSALPSGRYGFVFRPTDDTLANPTDTISAVVYRHDDKKSPVGDLLVWVPATSVSVDADGRGEVMYALGDATRWLHYALATDSVLIERGTVEVASGINRLPISLPAGVVSAKLSLWAAGNYRSAGVTIGVERARKSTALNVEVEAMRDRLVPGNDECWTVRVTDADATPARTALIMNVLSQSITSLAPQSLSLTELKSNRVASFNRSASGLVDITASISRQYSALDCSAFGLPEFQTYGLTFYPVRFVSQVLYRSKAQLAALNVVDGGAAESTKALAATDTFAASDTAETTDLAEALGDTADDSSDYRRDEEPLALFAPMLTTDASGRAVVEFTLPNANTTWRVLALAYDKNLRIGSLQRDVIASKPVMVSPNAPRFLRCGDVADIPVSVMNASEETLTVTTVVETFDPTTRRVLSTDSFVDTIAAGRSVVVTTRVVAGDYTGLLGYRVKSSAAGFTDGEQSLLPIVPALQPVVTSRPFYLTADDTSRSIDIDAAGETTVVLNTNPVGTVLTALPGLMEDTDVSAPSAVAALFGAAVADGLISGHSQLRDLLREMADNPADSALVSALLRNQDLKLLMISQSPWESQAMTQSERMARLTLLLQPDQVTKSLEGAVATLARLQRSGGGLAWRDYCDRPSEWMTRRFLARVAQLDELGYRPSVDGLDRIIGRAACYCDSLSTVAAARDPKYIDLDYAFVRYRLSGVEQSASAKSLSKRTAEWLRSNWRSLSLENKARASMLLDYYGYSSVADSILSSISQYAVDSRSLGTYFPSLSGSRDLTATATIYNAFSALRGADDPTAAGLRQWLLLRKDISDWGASESTSWVVASLLSTAAESTSTVSSPTATLTRGGVSSQLPLSLLTTTVAVDAPATLTLEKDTADPMWGAVINKTVQRPASVAASSTPNLSIEKRLLKRQPDGSWLETTEFVAGDQAEVALTIKADQTMDYVVVADPRAATYQPVDQLPGYVYADGLAFYRESRDAVTNLFIDRLPRGTYVLTYRVTVNNPGTFTSGVATIQSQYAPGETANSTAPYIHVISTNQ